MNHLSIIVNSLVVYIDFAMLSGECGIKNLDHRSLDDLVFRESLDAPEIGTIVFARYRTEAGDNPSPQLVEFYKCCRAALRSKLSIWHLWEPQVRDPARWLKQARSYLDLAATYAERLSSEDVPAN